MGEILNSKGQLQIFQSRCRNSYYIDKSEILEKLNSIIGKIDQQYVCITRPRRFGKTVMTNLLASYYAKGLESRELFDKLKISQYPDYEEHLNQHNVISLNMSKLPEDCTDYHNYISFHRNKIKKELIHSFQENDLTLEMSLWDMLEEIYHQTGENFIFIIDEWDSYFHSDFYTIEDSIKYLTFLKNHTYEGNRLYNPRSIDKALNQNVIKNYWTETGPGTEILSLVKHNVDEVKEDFLKLVSGQKIDLASDEFTADLSVMETKEEIYSAMVIYGFLSYYDGQLSIPNKEIMKKFQKVLKDKSLGYIAELAKNSDIMLKATINGNTEKMEEILEFVHNTEIPLLQYNDENSLSCIVNLIYLSARDKYRIEREDMTGKGFADFIFYPLRAGDVAIILELKSDDTPEHALEQIIEKKYDTKLREMKSGKAVCTGPILYVGMAYNKKTKEHRCIVQRQD